MSKSQSPTFTPNSQQQGGKNVQIGRPHSMPSTSLSKGVTTSDEFKYGFPSDGLSTVSNKWWGSSRSEGVEKNQYDGGTDEASNEDGSSRIEHQAKHENEVEKNIGTEGTGLLMAVRKRIVEEGRESLKLGVMRNYGANKLGKREKRLLLRIFKSSTDLTMET